MKTFKIIDYCLQVLLFAFGVFWVLLHSDKEDCLLGYCFVAAGDLLSCLIHVALKYEPAKASPRNEYYKNMVCIVAIGAGCWAFGAMLKLYIYGMLLIFPVTALLYISICIKETEAWPDKKYGE
jgi:hypothetical protein